MFNEKSRLSKFKLDFRLIREIDTGLLIATILLVLYGIFNIYLCTKGDLSAYGPFYYVKKQSMSFVLSMVALYIFVAVDYRIMYRYITIFYWGSVALLIAVWIPFIGVEVNGARGWITLGIGNLQPAEVAKFAIILMVAKILDEIDCEVNNIRNIGKILIYVMIPVSLILFQPDMGMTMVCFFIVLGMIYVAGLDKRIILGGFLAIFLAIIVLWNTPLILPHQKARIASIMNPDPDNSANGYQLNQSLIGIGSGGLAGTQPSLDSEIAPGYTGTHVPEIQTDFIFAAIGEQWGFVGIMFLLGLYAVLITRMVNIARKAKDRFASLVCIGIVSYFLFAITQNIGMTIGLLPITGITLPLISYGGSSLLTTTMAVALVLNIGMRKKKIHF
ncbi:rod shape-determining protein RodA [Clostridium vincentii]|uniref:Lipid II flippase FtsW n=1 Tax=Clostridium vincentii TaxID=52704 RepID=A0A2T0BF46_9CLOT|nr:rod shape-determining protein RodA [Clostridium vincentii]PRR82437.1 Lipid II flippase FtsW [Clostridium vincentii]